MCVPFRITPSASVRSLRYFQNAWRCTGQSQLGSGHPWVTIEWSERSFSSLAVSSLIYAILVGLPSKWRCSSWTDASSHSIVSPVQGLILDNASASGMFLPCTYLISALYSWTLCNILAICGGTVLRCFLKIASNGLWSVLTVMPLQYTWFFWKMSWAHQTKGKP